MPTQRSAFRCRATEASTRCPEILEKSTGPEPHHRTDTGVAQPLLKRRPRRGPKAPRTGIVRSGRAMGSGAIHPLGSTPRVRTSRLSPIRRTARARSRHARLLRNLTVISATGPAPAVRPVEDRKLIAPDRKLIAPEARMEDAPSASLDVSIRSAVGSNPIQVSRSVDVSPPERARVTTEKGDQRRLKRRRALVLAGGVAAAVIAIVAVVAFATGQRSGTA